MLQLGTGEKSNGSGSPKINGSGSSSLLQIMQDSVPGLEIPLVGMVDGSSAQIPRVQRREMHTAGNLQIIMNKDFLPPYEKYYPL